MKEWNAEQYLKFKKERTQPSLDLVARLKEHRMILDIGSGPGNSTNVLKKRYWDAQIIGAECDENMLKKARENYPELSFEQAYMPDDFYKFGKFDLIFSNACIHWIPNQEGLFQEIYNHLEEDGEVAVQLPLTDLAPFHFVIKKVCQKYPHLEKLENFYNLDAYGYYNLLNRLGYVDITIWQTTYMHLVQGIEDIIHWYAGTGLKPYLDRIGNQKEEFLKDIKLEIEKQYTKLNDGSYFILMPRLFIVARKGEE